MSYLKGEDIVIGVAKETTRKTFLAPTLFVPGRSPAGIQQVVEQFQIRETKGTGMTSQGMGIYQKRTEGDFEINVRSKSIAPFLLSLMGKVTNTTLVSGVYQHVFDILTGNPQFPTLSIALAQLGQQDYAYAGVLCTKAVFKLPINDLINATLTLKGLTEATNADFTPSFGTDDHHFRHFDVTIKIAANVAGLSGATALKLKDYSLTVDNNGEVNQNISEVTPGDVLAKAHEISGDFTIDYQDETFHDLYVNGTYQAMSITLSRNDVDLGSGNRPSITFLLPKISFNKNDYDRPIDDIVGQKMSFMSHFSDADGYGFRITTVDNQATI